MTFKNTVLTPEHVARIYTKQSKPSKPLAEAADTLLKEHNEQGYLTAEMKNYIAERAIHRESENEIPELARRVARHDHYYQYSDSMSVYNAGERNRAELKELIENSEHNDEEKVILISGLNDPKGVYTRWPALDTTKFADWNKPMAVRLYDENITVEDLRRLHIAMKIAKMALLADGDVDAKIVKSSSAPNEREIAGKVAVTREAQKLWNDFHKAMTGKCIKAATILKCLDTSDTTAWVEGVPNPMFVDGYTMTVRDVVTWTAAHIEFNDSNMLRERFKCYAVGAQSGEFFREGKIFLRG